MLGENRMLVNGLKILESPAFRRILRDLSIATAITAVFSFFGYVWGRTGGYYFTLKKMHLAYGENGAEGLAAFLLDEEIAKTDDHAKKLVEEYEKTYYVKEKMN